MKPKTVPYEKKNKPRCSSCGSSQVYTRKSAAGAMERRCIKCNHTEPLKEQR